MGILIFISMDKYRLVKKKNEKVAPTEIRVNGNTRTVFYLNYIASLFEKGFGRIEIKGAGYAISTALNLSSLVRKRFAGLHQIVEFGQIDVEDVYEPIEEGLDNVVLKKQMPILTIVLSKKELDRDHPGYDAPLPASEIQPYKKKLGEEEKEGSSEEGGMRGRGRGSRGVRGAQRGNQGRGRGARVALGKLPYWGSRTGTASRGFPHHIKNGVYVPKGSTENQGARRRGRFRPIIKHNPCLLYTSPSPRDATLSRMPSSA
eukprot:TRINITY_DN3146_c0_g1_i1.p1 TRINITY_DN3146_c0_g1~~TRINITY_DN3146_c0_g1_i1.p1  ORF type:complete len:277 (-),score=72.76 TRINITY_DN3146_c0_g1_i1:20-799(-)